MGLLHRAVSKFWTTHCFDPHFATNLLPFEWIVSTIGKFTHNMIVGLVLLQMLLVGALIDSHSS